MRKVKRRTSTGPDIDSEIFKAYDIRGTVPDQIRPEIATLIGRAFAHEIAGKKIAVGRDVRTHSEELTDALCAGLLEGGCHVIDVGLVSTDALYFAVGHLGCDGGVMVTASHNPPEYNGFKMCRAEAEPLSGNEGIKRIQEMVELADFDPPVAGGTRESHPIIEDFTNHVLSFVNGSETKPFKVVVDAGNGMAGITVRPVFDRLPCELIPMYFDPDGTFPNHPPDPLNPKNLEDLIARVKEENADFGVAFDGDADRLFLVDETGQPVSGDIVTLLVAKSLLAKNPGATILYNIICSRAVPEAINAAGGRAVRTPVGHALIKPIMKREDAVFGGEHSGHFYFKHNWNADSGLIAMVVAMETISEAGCPLSELVASVDPYVRSGEINTRVASIPRTLQRIEKAFDKEVIDHSDGLTIAFDEWWFNVRPSNTEPLLRLNIEANSAEVLEEKTADLLRLIRGKRRASAAKAK
ncbi:MAG TPA: phosphomannomutase/phosphoglucomutase [Acidobacteriota bacterium]|nr:phosphomannomutase/phosphoglucomutase [Acidobacteriota bacterium]